MADEQAPERIGDYVIEHLLGEGGMAKVYRARHSILDTVHALKVLDPSLRVIPEARRRFLEEAKIQAKHLNHRNIAKVTNVVATAEHAALVMELVDGHTLESQIGKLQDRPAEVRKLMLGILRGVEHAHQAGIIHRDLKPANVLLAREDDEIVPKVTDFGIAKVTAGLSTDAGQRSTRGDARMGTLQYMSPEQVRGAKHVTAQSDIFSLGAMLYELATGALPFIADSDFDSMRNIVDGTYEPPQKRNPRIDPLLAAVITKALSPSPAQRFASCAEMARALTVSSEPRRIAQAPSPPVPGPPPGRAGPAQSRAMLFALLGTGVLLAGAVVFAAIRLSGSNAAPPAAPTIARADVIVDAAVRALAPLDSTLASDAQAAQQVAPTSRPRQALRPRSTSPTSPTSPTSQVSPPPADPSDLADCDETFCVVENYQPPCCSSFRKVPKAAPTASVDTSQLPDGMDRTMIQDGVNTIKARVMACADLSSAKGQVKVSVKVSAGGTVSSVTVKSSPDAALGSCVANAMQRATFAKTQNGGSFAYPWNF